MTGHNFYAIRTNSVKDWDTRYAPVPQNYHLLDKSKGDSQIPITLDYDLVFSQTKDGQYQLLSQIARQLHLPLLSLTHTSPVETWHPSVLQHYKDMKSDMEVFISEDSRKKWGYENNPLSMVIEHGIDTDLFESSEDWHGKGFGVPKQNIVLSVMNEAKQRDYFLGFTLWEQIAKKVPIKLIGDNLGLSKAAKDQEELAIGYGDALIFLNTSQVSPIPMSLLEAMSAKCLIISSSTCLIPDVIEHGVNGFLYNTAEEAVQLIKTVLANPNKFQQIRDRGHDTIKERFGMSRFVSQWDKVFRETASLTFKGA